MLQSYKKTLTPNPSIPIFSSAMHKGAGLGADIYLIIYRRRRIRFAIRWWSRLGENGIPCCLFLHQTTTMVPLEPAVTSCISSVSCIKPQPSASLFRKMVSCISSVSYIKPQLLSSPVNIPYSCISSVSYIKPQPINNTAVCSVCCISSVSYIKPQL